MTVLPEKWLLAVLLICGLWGASLAQNQDVPAELRQALRAESSMTLYSVHPDQGPAENRFLGYPILGQTEVSASVAKALKGAVLEGLEKAEPASKQSCFSPRHGLALGGQKLLICYQCHSVIAESKSGRRISLAITDSGHAELARAVSEGDLPWQGWQPVAGRVRHQSGVAVSIPEGYKAHSSAGTETLFLEAQQETVQSDPLRGSFVLVYDDGAEQSYPTEWLDHRSTGKRMWYRYGVSSTFEASENRRVYRGSSYDLDPIKESLMKADEPTRTKAWVKVRPADDRAALKTQFHRMRRKGYTLEDASGPLHGFKTATTRQGGIEMRAAVGAVSTKAGLVMIFSEIPVAEPDPLPALIRDLQQ